MFIDRLKSGVRFFSGHVMIPVLLILTGIFSYSGMKHVTDAIREASETGRTQLAHLYNLNASVSMLYEWQKVHLLAETTKDRYLAGRKMAEAKSGIAAAVDAYAASLTDEESRRAFAAFRESADRLVAMNDSIVSLSEAGDTGAGPLSEIPYRSLNDIITSRVRGMMEASLVEAGTAGKKEYEELFWHMLVGIALLFVVSVILTGNIVLRRRSERALRESEGKLRAIFQAARDISFIVTDVRGAESRIREFSPGAERVFGYRRDEVIGRGVAVLYGQQDVHRMAQLQKEIREKRDGVTSEMDLTRRSGERFPAMFTMYPLSDASGEVTEALAVAVDISQLKQLEDQLRQAQKMEAVGRLAGGVAHDFNNLLTAIIGFAEVAIMSVDEKDPLRGDLEEIRKAGGRARELTRQLMALGRKQVLEMKVVDLNAIVRSSEKMLRRIIRENVAIGLDLSPHLGNVRVDSTQIEQVLVNLAVNAMDSMPQGGTLSIRTANADLEEEYAGLRTGVGEGPYVMLAVSDTGCGMDAGTLERLFEPFFTTKKRGERLGMGLATVHGIVEQHGGYIRVDSVVGGGSTFEIYLPRVSEEVAAAPVAAHEPDGGSGGETVLVVEDEPAVLRFVHAVLSQRGYRVMTAPDSERAVEILERGGDGVDLLLTDVVLPGINGAELYRRLSAMRPNLKVLYMSGYTENVITHHGALDEGVHYMQKPFTASELADAVRRALER